MAFDQHTRIRLQRFVSEARTLLTAECTRQLQHEYGMDPATGEVVELSKLPPLDDTRWETARLLRDTLAHYLATSPSGGRTEALQRIVREQAFTVLNRLVALRMMEARGLLLESIARSYQSRGFQLYQRLAGAALGETGDAYRCYLISLFDEFALDLAVLFDRFSPQGRLFPRESALLALFGLINHPDIESLWAEDETIGWIYQYYNAQEERRQMRADSPAPRNSRELAVRNQFFTPRYVVEFLTDNTLGRLWYEMTQGRTVLTEQCRYLVRRPNEIFLQPGEEPPAQEEPHKELSQEELLQQPVYIPFRALKDPRDIRMLDPACGSMHFGLYAFDLFEVIYDEAWEIAHKSDEAQKSSSSFVSFVVQSPDKAAFLADVPRLIIEHNLHGIDIDPRAVQIAGLSLWLRAQRTWQQQRLRPQDRPDIRRSNIVCAEPMPGEEVFLDEFIEAHLAATPEHKLLGQLVRRVFDAMKLAGEAGSLLKIEEEIAGTVAEAKKKWFADTKPEQGRLFADDIAPPAQQELGLDVTGITDETFWEKAEERIYAALQSYAEQAEHGDGYQRRLFADDAARGFAFIDLCRKRYDVALMNPPFGEPSRGSKPYIQLNYPKWSNDVLAGFIGRWAQQLVDGGLLGAITSRTAFFLSSFESWRERVLLEVAPPTTVADLGQGVLDSAMVETAAYCLQRENTQPTVFFRLIKSTDRADGLKSAVGALREGQYVAGSTFVVPPSSFTTIPGAPFSYWVSETVRRLFQTSPQFEDDEVQLRVTNPTADEFRFLRNFWECSPAAVGRKQGWVPYAKGGSSRKFHYDVNLLAMWDDQIPTYKGYVGTIHRPDIRPASLEYFFRPAIMWPLRAPRMSAQAFPEGTIFSARSQCLFAPPKSLNFYLGLLNSCTLDYLFKAALGRTDFPEFIIGILRKLPKPPASEEQKEALAETARNASLLVQRGTVSDEVGHCFTSPALARCRAELTLREVTAEVLREADEAVASIEIKQRELDLLSFAAYGITPSDQHEIERQLAANADIDNTDTDDCDDEGIGSEIGLSSQVERLASWLVGSVFGRWDIRYATGEKPVPELPDPFAPLPVCPPGQLQNEQGLPISKGDVTRLKEEGRWHYPLEIPWDGILVDDPGHPLDLETRVHQVMQIIWKNRWEAIEREACEILGVRTLRDYFRKAAGFFADHLKRYSKSRRKAPIYWPLQTPSGSYTLWLYYHRLNDQTLYTCVNDFIEKSKLREVTEQLNVLRTKTSRSKQEENDLERLLDLEHELQNFRDELLRVAPFWKPNLNDGVQITAAPLWKLFQYRPWQNTLKDTWEKLEEGDYDWAHLAYSIWPDRVREKCRHDKSLAIAHGLEELYEALPEQPRKKRGRTRG